MLHLVLADSTPATPTSSSSVRYVASDTRATPRRRATSAVIPSQFRPHVLARERLASWTSPYAHETFDVLGRYFPAHVLARWREVALASVTDDTRKNYGAGLLRFIQFCDRYGVPEHLRMPASESLLALFVAEMGAGNVQSGTVQSWLSGLAMWHQVCGAPWNGGSILARTKKGAAAMSSRILPRRPPRSPVSLPHMTALRQHLDMSNTFDAAVWAVACAAWRGCCRLGELLPRDALVFDKQRHMSRGTAWKEGIASNGHAWLSLFAPFTKTKLFEGDWLVFTATADDINVVDALRHHWAVNHSVPDDAPMFAYETATGWATLAKDAFMGRCQEIWVACDLGSVLGHGFRIGGTTFLLLRGTEPWIVMKQGRWSSKAFLRYWRNVEEILPLFIGNTLDSYDSLRITVERSVQRMEGN
ncbi:hypothetical protein BD626DRAFT_402493 [Schizophyllum amplum]|uniref:Core-binding (CB) domain-containing protein n=1 Tax=Schizophyllum amplum TaxID=97359 RepID=A0A550CF45_9AGAR|nr:hypothetical protein BD626DRAFT_402493 [Auriculariopsis ampla]